MLKELKTSKILLVEISNRKQIIETEKGIKKLEKKLIEIVNLFIRDETRLKELKGELVKIPRFEATREERQTRQKITNEIKKKKLTVFIEEIFTIKNDY
ncbi:MAG: hypothetical protein ACTSRI_03895 [Promethearchaeota archaeon]